MKISMATISESASIDQQTNQVSIFNIIEMITALGPLPFQYPRMTLVAIVERDNDSTEDEEAKKIRISFKSPTGVVSTLGEIDVSIGAGKRKTRMIMNMLGMQVSEPGLNEILMEIKNGSVWKDAYSISFEVTVSAITD